MGVQVLRCGEVAARHDAGRVCDRRADAAAFAMRVSGLHGRGELAMRLCEKVCSLLIVAGLVHEWGLERMRLRNALLG